MGAEVGAGVGAGVETGDCAGVGAGADLGNGYALALSLAQASTGFSADSVQTVRKIKHKISHGGVQGGTHALL